MNCKDSKVQEYQCYIQLRSPYIDKIICVDKCLKDEILDIWSKGIRTTGCCCGNHSNCKSEMSYIGVDFNDIQKMKDLGYVVRYNPCRQKDEDSFIPKTRCGIE